MKVAKFLRPRRKIVLRSGVHKYFFRAANCQRCAARKMAFSLNRKSSRVRCPVPRAATMNPERANYFQDFARIIASRASLLAILVTHVSREAYPRSTFQFKDKESCTEKKIDRRRDADQRACPSCSLASSGGEE